MPRRPAKVTQTDIERAIRAAKHAGANEVIVDSEGTIRISLGSMTTPSAIVDDRDQSWTPSEALARYLKRSESG